MNVTQLKTHCSQYPHATAQLHAAPSNILVYAVADKTFAYFKTSEPEKWRFSFRAAPDRFLELTGMPGVKPARWRGRFHWVTIVDVRSFPDDYLRELLEWSYRKAISTLPKKKQAEILQGRA